MNVRDRVTRHRRAMRDRGLRPLQIWVPDTRTETFATEVALQAQRVRDFDAGDDSLEFLHDVAAWPDEESW